MGSNRLKGTSISVALLVLGGGCVATESTSSTQVAVSHDAVDTVIPNWSAIASNALITVDAETIQQSELNMAIMHAAIYDAVNSIGGHGGHYRQFAVTPTKRHPASREAAAAQAAHDVLVRFVPAQQASLDAALATSLAAIADGKAKDNGVLIGAEVAASMLALHNGVIPTVAYVYGPPDPGVYQRTPPAFANALLPGFATVTPFTMSSPSQFRAGPPPDLSSTAWVNDYNETKAYGQDTSTVRTAIQTETGRFYTEQATQQYSRAFRTLAAVNGFTIEENARFFAMANVALIDSLIACWDSKYHYSFWRPSTAIRAGGGNASLIGDPAWLPLAVTPAHPEYPAAHGCGTSAIAEVIKQFFRTKRVSFSLSSTVTGTTHDFTNTDDLKAEIINARVYGGMHYRNSVVVGTQIGASVVKNMRDNHVFQRGDDDDDHGDGDDDDDDGDGHGHGGGHDD
jgi:PAP2 superfamily